MNREAQTDELSDELLDAEIPCMGIINPGIERSCSHAAALRTLSHGHCAAFKCIACWQIWYVYILNLISMHGYVECGYCARQFTTVESFSDYRPF